MKIVCMCFTLSVILMFCNNKITNETIKIPIIYHFLYDTSRYNQTYLRHDSNSIKIEHDALNQIFEGKILFENFIYQTHYFNKTLYEVFRNYVYHDQSYLDFIVDSWSVKGYLNVFILRTETVDGYVLNGFTPLSIYEESVFKSPKHDNVYISFDALFEYTAGATLAHEIGHWLTLKHPFQGQMTLKEQYDMGLYSKDIICTNIMNYNCYVKNFTIQQLNTMVSAAKKYRYYLIEN